MEQIIITNPDGTTIPLIDKYNTTIATKADQTQALLGEDVVSITAKSARRLPFQIGGKIDVFGKVYKLNQLPEASKTGTRKFEYTLTFEGIQYDLIDVQWLLPDDTVLDSFTGDLEAFLDMIISNANRVFPGQWVKGVFPADTEYKTLTYTGNNCLEILQNVCGEWGVEFELEQSEGVNTVNIKTAGVNFPYTFFFGRTGGLYELTRKNISSKDIVTRLYVYGGSTNIGSSYRHTKLCLAGALKNSSYIESAAAIAAFGVKENTNTFDDIYPNRIGEVTGEGSKYYAFVDSTMNFDLNELEDDGVTTKWLIDGVKAKVEMNTGNLAGYEFEVHSYDHTTKEIQVVPFTDESGYKFPSETTSAFQFGIGDKYIFTDINLPDAYYTEKEAELQDSAEEYYNQYCKPQVQYGLTIDQNFIKQFAGGLTIANLFAVGDYVPVVDEDLDIDKTIRITGFTRDLLQPYKYSITLGDSVTKTLINRVIEDLQEVDRVIEINNLADPSNARRNWMAAQEVLANVFDPDGDYYSEKIKPLSIETTMLATGARSQQFIISGSYFDANHEGNENSVYVVGGSLIHYTIEDVIKTWTLNTATTTLTSSSQAYYIYAKCQRAGTAGSIVFDTAQRTVDSDPVYYYFLLGTLSSVITDTDGTNPARLISLTYGSSTINGRFINTGRIQSSGGGTTYFDLDNGEIGGNIKFISSDGSTKDVSQLDLDAQETKDYINNTLPGLLSGIQSQLDGQIEQFFETVDPTTSNAPANTWTTTADKEDHLGDLYYNTSSGAVFRWIKDGTTYSWQQLQDTEVANALAIANDALALAGTKRRIFTAQPYTPYEVGDLWVQGTAGDIMKCKTARASGSYSSSDWEKASNYTSDAALQAFILGDYTTNYNDLIDQIDGKIESWFQTADPSTAWTTTAIKAKHVGDMWYSSSTQLLKRYTGSAWTTIEDKTAIDAYAAASQAQDTADGKRRVFVDTPYPPYDVGDLWVNGQVLRRCATARASGSYIANDWVSAVNYDNTQTVIDGGLVTSGTIQLAGSGGSILAGITGDGTASTSVRHWAGASFANRATAPYRVLQDGTIIATKAIITGEINATSGTFNNIVVNGSTRSPFTNSVDSFSTEYSDNIAMLSTGGWATTYSLPWTEDQSGRKMCLTNYRWGSSYSSGYSGVSAPSGKYFYENGVAVSSLQISRECVELLGFGDSSTFYGWIVLQRINLMTAYRYGRQLNVLAQGTVTGKSSGASIYYKTFDGSTMSVTRAGTGYYKVTFSSSWIETASDCIIMATGYGDIYGGSNPNKASVTNKGTSYFYVKMSDDTSTNDGSFMFQITNLSDWN